MRRFLLRCLLNGLALYIAAALIPEMILVDFKAVLYAAVILGLINLILRPVILLVALPVNLLTLGIFTVVVDTWMVLLMDRFASGITIPGFWNAALTALIVYAVNWVLWDKVKK